MTPWEQQMMTHPEGSSWGHGTALPNNLSQSEYMSRLAKGWSVDDAYNQPPVPWAQRTGQAVGGMLESMNPWHLSSMVPVPLFSDAAGLVGDYQMYRDEPESRTWPNYMLSGAAALTPLPGVAAMTSWQGSPTKWAPEPGHPLGRPRLDKVGTGEGIPAEQMRLPAPPRGFDYPDGPPKNAVTGGRRLTKVETENLNALGASKGEAAQVKNAAIKYRNTYPANKGPGAGWQQFDINFVRDNKSGSLVWRPKGRVGEIGFTYSRDPNTLKPLTGQARREQVESLANSMVREVSETAKRAAGGDYNAKKIMNARHWYRDIRNKFRDTFGGGADIYADLQAATSPNTELGINFRTANEAFEAGLNGDFDELIPRIQKYLDDGGTWEKLPDNLIPRKANGTKYGMHGKRIMQVFFDDFRDIQAGKAPKMRNYGQNLIGLGNDATIDAWAARSMQRLSGRPVPPPVISEVPGVWSGSGLGKKPKMTAQGDVGHGFAQFQGLKTEGVPRNITDEFGMGQDVFREAAEKLKAVDPQTFWDMNPDDLQALMWLQEKNLWEANGWTPVQSEAIIGDMMDASPRSRFVAGVSATQADTPTRAVQESARQTLLKDLTESGGIARAPDTYGRWGDYDELSFDMEVVMPKGSSPKQMVDNVLQVGDEQKQMDVFVSRVLGSADNPNARPGVEIYIDPRNSDELLKRVQSVAEKHDIGGFTIINDSKLGGGNQVGARIQWIPEIDARFDKDLAKKWFDDPKALMNTANEKAAAMEAIAAELQDVPGITYANPVRYETAVYGRNASGNLPGDFLDAKRGLAGMETPWNRAQQTLPESVRQSIIRLNTEMGWPGGPGGY